MKCYVRIGFFRRYIADFKGCATLIDVREWLNGTKGGNRPFINIGNKRIIRLDKIKMVTAA